MGKIFPTKSKFKLSNDMIYLIQFTFYHSLGLQKVGTNERPNVPSIKAGFCNLDLLFTVKTYCLNQRDQTALI